MICTTDRGRNVSSIENMKAESEGPYLNSPYINDSITSSTNKQQGFCI